MIFETYVRFEYESFVRKYEAKAMLQVLLHFDSAVKDLVASNNKNKN
jgi:hypothetical protein